MGSLTFEGLWRELTGFTPNVDAIQAQKFVNRARVDIYEAHKWSFLYARTIVPIPASIETGLVAVVNGSSWIVFDADARAVLDAIGMEVPITQRQIKINGSAPYNIVSYEPGTGYAKITPVSPTSDASTVAAIQATATLVETTLNPIDGTTVTVGGSVFTWVNVVVNPTDVLIGATKAISYQNMADAITLDPEGLDLATASLSGSTMTLTARTAGVDGNSITFSISDGTYGTLTAFSGGYDAGVYPGYVGATDSAATYVLAKRYYAPPSVDFLRWVSVINQTVPYKFWTNVPITKLDFFDPKRMIVGNPYVITQFTAGVDPAGSGAEVPLYELWPTPSYDTQMVQVYMKRGSNFSGPTDTLPEAIPDDLLLERAKYRAAEWMMANAGRFPEAGRTNWAAIMQLSNAEYQRDLKKYIRQDRETFANAEIVPNNVGMYSYPMWDATYLQISSLSPDFIYGSFGFPW